MSANVFNTAANAPPHYVFDYDREVAAFYRSHREQKRRVYFIDASAIPGAVCCGNEADEDEAEKRLASNGYLYAATEQTYKTGKGGAVRFDAEGYGCVILKLPRNRTDVSLLGYDTPSDIADVFSFDHEIGHLICPDGYDGDPLMKECIADAYAVIRHFQRFGADSPFIRNLPAMRAVEMILGRDGGHFSAPVVEKIISDAQKTDFRSLTPAGTAALATRYAKEHAMDRQLVSFMGDHFNTVHLKPIDILTGNFNVLKKFGELILKAGIPEEFKWGRTAVHAMLDGNIGVDGIRLPKPQGAEWMKLRQALDARAAKFEQPRQQKLIIVSGMNF